ncbi:MAG: hypothetical protein EXR77_19190, partial [Myxococcales bacterium]|nr:hypothetical protein [Myxococcales bacterium]
MKEMPKSNKSQEKERRRQRILTTYSETGSIGATVRKLKVSIHTVRKVLRAGTQPQPVAAVRQPAKRP